MKESRRKFIKKATCGLGMLTLATQAEHFGLMTALAQKVSDKQAKKTRAAGGNGYKAIVCVFLSGGNDGNNTIIPNHNDSNVSSYEEYASMRAAQGLALPQNTLLPISVPSMSNLSYGLHPSFGQVTNGLNNGIHELYGQGKMAFAINVGTLVKTMNKTQYQNGSIQRPFQLFSHSDQVSQFQAGRSDKAGFVGWGGSVSDRMSVTSNPNALVPMITSLDGAQLFTAGQSTSPLAISDARTPLNEVLNPSVLSGDDPDTIARRQAFDNIRLANSSSNYRNAANAITNSAMEANSALASFDEVNTAFPNNSIGRQLKQVARVIKKQNDLNIDRQVFYVERGGFDTHNNQLNGHANRLTEVSQSVRAFYDEMVDQGLSEDVTIFMMSDFGRTMDPAGTGGSVGSDHGWGNHLFVIGDSVNGGDFYGTDTANGSPFPTLIVDGPDDATFSTSSARGRWIPTTSVEQYAATIARWFGLPQEDMAAVFPNLSSFTNSDMGFMQN